jgi:hypothetical protein
MPSDAARRLCLQMVDQQRDVTRSEVRGQPARLDITSADVATTPDKIVAVLRLRGWAADGAGNVDAASVHFIVSFMSDGMAYLLSAETDPSGTDYYGIAQPRGGEEHPRIEHGSGSIDERGGLVRIEIPRALFQDPKAKRTFDQLHAGTQAAGDVLGYADEVRGRRPYVDLTRTCIA